MIIKLPPWTKFAKLCLFSPLRPVCCIPSGITRSSICPTEYTIQETSYKFISTKVWLMLFHLRNSTSNTLEAVNFLDLLQPVDLLPCRRISTANPAPTRRRNVDITVVTDANIRTNSVVGPNSSHCSPIHLYRHGTHNIGNSKSQTEKAELPNPQGKLLRRYLPVIHTLTITEPSSNIRPAHIHVTY